MGFQGTGNSRRFVISSHKVPNVLAWMAIDTIPVPFQANLLEDDDEQSGYETEISSCEVKTSFLPLITFFYYHIYSVF